MEIIGIPMKRKQTRTLFALCLLVICCIGLAHAAPTSEVTIYSIGEDQETILNQTTVDYTWMEENLPVQGDGTTHYYHQGPVFNDNKTAQWDASETTNFKDHGAVKGTSIRDLCEIIGGMEPEDDVMIRAADGYNTVFGYENIYNPPSRQGPAVLCWYNGEDAEIGEKQGVGYPPDFYAGMRIVFFADNGTNSDGKHVFGNWDMHESFPAEKIYLFDNLYPSTNGYTVKWVDDIRIYQGGYTSADLAPVKSLRTETPRPTKSPLSPALPVLGVILGIGCVILRRQHQ